MELIFVRHAIAEDKKKFAKKGMPDSQRPLTRKGREEFEAVTHDLKKIYPSVSAIVSSDLQRATQTADLLNKRYSKVKTKIIKELRPGASKSKLLSWIKKNPKSAKIILVGHEPDISETLNYLLTGKGNIVFDVKKGSVIVLSSDHNINSGQFYLKCFIQPAQLKKLH